MFRPFTQPEPLQRWIQVAETASPSDTFVGTPSILIASDGTFWASHNWFGSGTSYNQTLIYKSTDSGATWSLVDTITGLFWAKLFEYDNELYAIGVDDRSNGIGGDLVIFKATAASGLDWATSTSTNISTGNSWTNNFLTAANTHVVQDGYFLMAVTERATSEFARPFEMILLWGDLTDLMTATKWGKSASVAYDTASDDANWSASNTGFLEPNLVNDGGTLKVIARHHNEYEHKACKLTVSWTPATPTGSLAFDDATGFVDVLGGSIQFVPVYHTGASKWLIVSNHEADFTPGSGSYGENDPNQRRWEQWLCSADTVDGTWSAVQRIHGSPYEKFMGQGVEYCGFQYASIALSSDEDTLYILNRTSWQGADTEHNANRLTFEKITGLNALLGASSGSGIGSLAVGSTFTIS